MKAGTSYIVKIHSMEIVGGSHHKDKMSVHILLIHTVIDIDKPCGLSLC